MPTVYEWAYTLLFSCTHSVDTSVDQKVWGCKWTYAHPDPHRLWKSIYITHKLVDTHTWKAWIGSRDQNYGGALPKENAESGSTFSAMQHINAALQLHFTDTTSLSHWYIEQHAANNTASCIGLTISVFRASSEHLLHYTIHQSPPKWTLTWEVRMVLPVWM